MKTLCFPKLTVLYVMYFEISSKNQLTQPKKHFQSLPVSPNPNFISWNLLISPKQIWTNRVDSAGYSFSQAHKLFGRESKKKS